MELIGRKRWLFVKLMVAAVGAMCTLSFVMYNKNSDTLDREEISEWDMVDMRDGDSQMDEGHFRFKRSEGEEFVEPPHNLAGEMGRPVLLPANLSVDIKKMVYDGWQKYGFNKYASDLISVRRNLPDYRDDWCKASDRFLKKLPTTSVVVCFHNEAWSALLRTVHSVLDRSPELLIKEIILVDDFSNMEHTKRQLEDYWANEPKVRIIRNKKREGFIKAKMIGAAAAQGQVITFLDSHSECTTGWLEPLLDRIAHNSSTVVSPVIDYINDTTLEYRPWDTNDVLVGGFDWSMQFEWHALPDHEKMLRKYPTEPLRSPVLSGEIFSIDKTFFEKLQMYDDGLEIWGGDIIELSLKTWMCGGNMEIVPCSHVGRIFRDRSIQEWRSSAETFRRNFARIAEVWLDGYAKYYYQRVGNATGDFGDVSGQKNMKVKLGCKSFKWYLDNIYPEITPRDTFSSGQIALFDGEYCLENYCNVKNICESVAVWPCHRLGGNQFWQYTKIGEIRHDMACLDYNGHEVILFPCHGDSGNQYWKYDSKTKLLRHGISGQCLSINTTNYKLNVEKCNSESSSQQWSLENFVASKV